MTDHPIRVPLECTGDSARNQLGEALLEHVVGAGFAVDSGGTDADRLEAFRHPRQELTQRLRPFIEDARRTAGVPVGSVAR